ncbi:MAG: FAD-linked oxidase C-terminal domain-containing protein [Thiohalomonadales bacterium]
MSEYVSKHQFIKRLQRLLPHQGLINSPEGMAAYECDGLSAYRALPWAVVLPDTVTQVCDIVRLCHELAVPIVARGAGTGLSGGALPHRQGIVLSLAKFDQIISVDQANRCACVQPGVRNLAISEAVAPLGLFYAPDPSSQIACTIGGNVAENSGGVHCLKYGLTLQNIIQIKVVSAEGELLVLGGAGYDSAGYDLLAILTGSEGLLGIIVEVTVKLLPIPEHRKVILASFSELAPAGQTVSDIIASGIIPAGLEMMDNAAIRAAEAYVHAGYPIDAAAILICELDGTLAEVDAMADTVAQLLHDGGASEVRIALDEAEARLYWQGRKAAFPAVGRISPDYYCMDGTIPRHRLAEVLTRISALSDKYQLAVANVFHAGDGNLHPLILYDANIPMQLEKTESFGAEILQACIDVGGTITGEHGVGMEKLDQMCVQFSTFEIEQFHALKAALDPKRILNPEKAIPTLQRCAEFGAMHVHQGKISFPELERF